MELETLQEICSELITKEEEVSEVVEIEVEGQKYSLALVDTDDNQPIFEVINADDDSIGYIRVNTMEEKVKFAEPVEVREKVITERYWASLE